MSKANGAARKAPTHFETVPLEVVKVIAAKDEPVARAGETTAPLEKPPVTPVPARAPSAKRR